MDEDKLKKELEKEFEKDWAANEWYTCAEIASKLKTETRSILRWNVPGLKRKDGKGFIILKLTTLKQKSARGKWVVKFLVERNLYGLK